MIARERALLAFCTLTVLTTAPLLSLEVGAASSRTDPKISRYLAPLVIETDPDVFFHQHLLHLRTFAVKFDVPVRSVKPWSLTVNGSPATLVVGEGRGPYIFQGFQPPRPGRVSVLLSAGEIRREEGEVPFEGRSWSFWVWDPAVDTDDDGLYNRTEVEKGTDPLADDTDGDGIPDEVELAYPCLNPAVDETARMRSLTGDDTLHRDFDGDGLSDLEEFRAGTNPCLAPERARALDKPVLERNR